MIINNTSEFFEELTKAALTNSGWEVEPVNGFIRATHPNSEESYLICTVGLRLWYSYKIYLLEVGKK